MRTFAASLRHPRRTPTPARSETTGSTGGARLQDLLVKTSRTFALCVPELPEPTRREVCVAYLLFRIADTFEDATVRWSRATRTAALTDFSALLGRPSGERARALTAQWLADPPVDHSGYLELLAQTPLVVAAMNDLSAGAREVVSRHALRTTLLMRDFVERTRDGGALRVEDLAELRAYCYAVAGIVGELLTDLFLLDRAELRPVATYLERRSALFGEGLQLVNILKDTATDRREGRDFLPPGTDREDLFALARRDLLAAAEYCAALQAAGAPLGILTFTALPVELAWATLDKVERKGPGARISRPRVFLLRQRVRETLASGRPILSGILSRADRLEEREVQAEGSGASPLGKRRPGL